MSLLILNAFLLTILVLLINNEKSRNNGFLFSVIFVVLLYLHSCINPNTMEDLPRYCDSFRQWASMALEDILVTYRKTEYAFLILNWFVSLFTDDFGKFMLVESFIMMLCYYIWCFKYSPYIMLSLLLMLLLTFNQSIFVLRQHLAIAITLLSYPYILNRKMIPYLCICGLAFFMHHSSIVWLPIYFFYSLKSRKKTIVLLVALTFLVSYSVGHVGMLNEDLDLGYDSYITGNKVGTSNLVEFFINIAIFAMYIFALKQKALDEGLYKLLTILLLLSVVGAFLGTSISTLTRLLLYYKVAVILAIPVTILHLKSNFVKVLYVSICLLIFAYVTFWGSTSIYYIRMSYLDPSDVFVLVSVFSYFLISYIYKKIKVYDYK